MSYSIHVDLDNINMQHRYWGSYLISVNILVYQESRKSPFAKVSGNGISIEWKAMSDDAETGRECS